LPDAITIDRISSGNVIELSYGGNETPTKSVIEATNGLGERILGRLESIELSGADNLVATCSAPVRTELQKRIGGYREELPHTGDMEMWLPFGAHASVGFIFAYQGVYRRHRANMSTAYYFLRDGSQIFTNERSLGSSTTMKIRFRLLLCTTMSCRSVSICVADFTGSLQN
jgi:hypothetical protein